VGVERVVRVIRRVGKKPASRTLPSSASMERSLAGRMRVGAIRTLAAHMKAIVREKYGSPDVLRVDEVPTPEVEDGHVLVRVYAAGVNRGDWYVLRGKPALIRPMMGGVRRPRQRGIGSDFAGVIEAVGKDVDGLAPGDEVFGGGSGALAEYVAAKTVVRKPANITFEEAATVGVAGLTALQGLRDHGRVQPGQKVLVNGASGGVGTFAVQIAKALGGEVTAVCSTRNVELVRSLGADQVLDYMKDDFTRGGEQYELVFDVAGSRSWFSCRRVLTPRGTFVIVGSKATTPILGPLGHIAATRLGSLGSRRRVVFFVAKFNNPDLQTLADLMAAGKLKPVVERTYELVEAPEALREMGAGHVRSKLVVKI
jgi:NADPH:quinone reductase-like Zn-dependent oxidoreductase